MAFSDFTIDHSIEVVPSEVETSRFGYRIGRCTVPIRSSSSPTEVVQRIDASDSDIVFLRYPADRVTWFEVLIRQLERHVVLLADTLVYWELAVGAGNPPLADDRITTAPGESTSMVGDLITRVFADYSNHYSANPLLPADSVVDGYRQWAMGTPLGDSLVLFVDGSPAGVATLERTSDHIEILLAGVLPEWRGRGMYAHLLHGVASDKAFEVERIVISTQAHNSVVQRAWARYGFLPLQTFMTVHVIHKDIWKTGEMT